MPFFPKEVVWICSALLVVVMVVGCCNATNLMDGLDGLCGGVTGIIAIGYTFLAVHLAMYGGADTNRDALRIVMALALLGGVLGFVPFNFNPASIFMGDAGSMFLGYLLAVIPLTWSAGKGAAPVSILVPVLALGLPITDMCVAMVRRFLARRSIFTADRGHIHHRLLDLGLTHRRAVLLLYGTSVLFTVSSVLVYAGRSLTFALALVVLSALSVGGMWLLRTLGVIRSREQAQQEADQLEAVRDSQTAVANAARPARRPSGELERATL